MIPKKIHYCWFGGNPMPEEYIKYINTWKKYCPDYKIIKWNEDNFDVYSCKFTREAFENKKWAFLSDYARLKIIYDEGGIYLDTDVELIKSLDDLLELKCFFGTEKNGLVNTGLGFGAEKDCFIVREMLEQYNSGFVLENGDLDVEVCPLKNTRALEKNGYSYNESEIWSKNDIVVYPPNYFCPINYDNGVINITDETYSIHHYSASWKSAWLNRKDNLRKKCIRIFGYRTGGFIARIVCIPYSSLDILEKQGINGFFKACQKKVANYFNNNYKNI